MMEYIPPQDIRALTDRVRAELLKPEISSMYIGFREFPSGSCMDASLLLGTILKKAGLGEHQLIWAENEKGETHSWLQSPDYILDITADQFIPGLNDWFFTAGDIHPPQHLFVVIGRVPVSLAQPVPDAGYYKALSTIMARVLPHQ